MSDLPILTTVAALRATIRDWRNAGHSIAFVPTMGALHEGHLTLVREGLKQGCRVIASIFVNPTQFGPNEDFSKYPRTLEADAAKLASAGTSALFAPDVTEMYPDGFSTSIHVTGVSEGLCGAHRPGHFDGVATVVAKLLNQAQPDRALFGEKDFQQLQVIRRMVRDLDLPVEIVGVPTVRDEYGLALSSRNAYLSEEQRTIARQLNGILSRLRDRVLAGDSVESCRFDAINEVLQAGFDSIDYLEVCDPETLTPVEERTGRPLRVLVAARLGPARLIDNMAIPN